MIAPAYRNGLRVLDAFCCAGGMAMGYWLAGYDVVGVDINPQPHYPFTFIQGDAIEYIRAHGHEYDLGHGSPPCFPAGTPVLTARGMVPIEEVVTGDLVLTHRNRWRRVTDLMSRDAQVLATDWMAATADHPYWARSSFESAPGWMSASGIQGLYLAIPATAEELPLPAVDMEMGEAFWYMAGRWLGDGWARLKGGRGVSVQICAGKHKAEDLAKALDQTGLVWRRYEMRTAIRFTAHSRNLAEWLVENFGHGAAGKTLPGWAFGMRVEHREALLEGYRAADGSDTPTGGWSLTTVSTQLAFATRVLAAGLGWSTSVGLYRPPKRGKTIEDRPVRERPFWQVRFNRSDRYTREVDGHRWHRQRQAMKPRGVERVYDITVDEDHSFVAWGFAVHNCQAYTPLNAYNHKVYPDLIAPTREAFEAVGLPYVIENVEAAAPELKNPTLLCGPMFDLPVYRHRLLETNWPLTAPEHPKHVERCTRNGYLPTPDKPFMTITGGAHSRAWQNAACDAMNMPWIKVPAGGDIKLGIREVCEAIPPAYAQCVGERYLAGLSQQAAA